MSTQTLIKSTKLGYEAVGSSAERWFKQIWMQLGRVVVFYLWLMVSLIAFYAGATVHPIIGGVFSAATFFGLPVVWGYYKLRTQR